MSDRVTVIKEIQGVFEEAIELYSESSKREDGRSESYLQKLRQCDPQGLIQGFGSSVNSGLDQAQVLFNSSNYGQNKFLKKKTKSFWEILKETLLDNTLIILMIAAVVSLVVEYFFGKEKDRFWVDGVSILAAVIVCSVVGSISNYQKERQFAELDEMTEATYVYDVIRNGNRSEVHRSEIVPGDMIYLASGLEVPADCILLKAINVNVDQSALTGQSVQVLKGAYVNQQRSFNPLMISGSTIVSGQGTMMAVVVGRNSANGKKFEMIFNSGGQDEKTPLQQKLEDLAQKIGYLGLFGGGLILFVLTLRLLLSDVLEEGLDVSRDLPQFLSYLIIAITVLVAAIPEGLPLAVTITLAFSMKKMHDENILVRNLVSCETMGSAHYICTDKTGTITENKMKVMKIIHSPLEIHDVSSVQPKLCHIYLQTLNNAVSLNSSANLLPVEKGSQTEIALLKFMKLLTDTAYQTVRDSIKDEQIFIRLPFNSVRKRMSTGVILNGKRILYTTGASERILESCNMKLDAESGKVSPLLHNEKTQMSKRIDQLGRQAYRVIGIGYKEMVSEVNDRRSKNSKEGAQIEPQEQNGFVCLGFFGIEDLPRPESKQSIQEAQNAGIKVVMVTGDSSLTANKIAKEVGIQKPGFDISMEGNVFFSKLRDADLIYLSQQKQEGVDEPAPTFNQIHRGIWKVRRPEDVNNFHQFEQIIDGLSVLSRSKPEHKYLLVDGLIKAGKVVGVTGDGSNDAPALKRASIGMAMGKTGTQSAKNASDIVILDDRFDSIVRAIVWGRNVFVSIRKFLQFQLTINLFLIFITLISAALIRESIFTAVQILWFNLIMDSLAALALASDPPNKQQLLNQPPSSKQQSLITWTMVKHVLGQAVFQFIVCMLILFLGFRFIPEYKDAFDSVLGADLQAKYYKGQSDGGTVQDGRMYSISGQDNYKIFFDQYGIHSRHFTFLFNTVVFLQIFNFFSCRKIKDQILTYFHGLFSTFIFWFIVMFIVGIEIVVIEFLNSFFGLYEYGGLTIQQWLLSIAIGMTSIPWSILLRIGIFSCHKCDERQQNAWLDDSDPQQQEYKPIHELQK